MRYKSFLVVLIILFFCSINVLGGTNVWIDLSATDLGDWVGTSATYGVAVDSDGNVYTVGNAGKFGVYSPVTNVWSDLSTTDAGNWAGTQAVNSISLAPDGNVYTVGNAGAFGVYSPVTNVWTNLNANDTGEWFENLILYCLGIAPDGNVYIGSANGKFGVYSPVTNVWIDLSATDLGDWVGTSATYGVAVDSDGNVYTVGTAGRFGVYSPVTNVWTNLSATDNGNWASSSIFRGVGIAPDGNVYTVGNAGKFGVYSPVTNVWTNLNANDTAEWFENLPLYCLGIAPDGNVYIGSVIGHFGVYSPVTNVWIDLSATDLGDWVGTSITYGVAVAPDGNVYIALANGKFGVYLGSVIQESIMQEHTITFNVKDLDNNNDLNFVSVDCNVNDYDLTNQTSPFVIDFNEGSYSCIFSKPTAFEYGFYDTNTIIVVADENKSYEVTLNWIDNYRFLFNIFASGTETHINGVNFDCNVNALDLTNQDFPFYSPYYDRYGSANCSFSATGYDTNNLDLYFYWESGTSIDLNVYLTETVGFSFGDGTLANPYQIFTIEDLNMVRNYLDANFVLMNDLNFDDCASYLDCDNQAQFITGAGWDAIGIYDEVTPSYFLGSFDGNNFVISNLFMDGSSVNGLFVGVGGSGVVKDLGVADINFINAVLSGGIAVELVGLIDNCYSTGSITSTSSDGIGGLVASVGYVGGTISNSYSSVNINNSNNEGGFAGGLVAISYWDAIIYSSHADGNIISYSKVGGFVGSFRGGSITNSYARGNVTCTSDYCGGFVGAVTDGTITKSYSTGVVDGVDLTGGFIGGDEGGSNGFSSDFWDVNTSGITTSGGNAVGKTTTEMKTQSTFTDADWNFDTIWSISSSYNNGYPNLDGFNETDACVRTINQDWTITTEIDCTGKTIDLGTGKLILDTGGRLRLFTSTLTTSQFKIVASGSELHLGSGSQIKIG